MEHVGASVIVEPRKHFALEYVISNMQTKLPNWPIYFWCGKGLKTYWECRLPECINIIELAVENLTQEAYSDLLKSRFFWEQVLNFTCLAVL